ncbi:MAG: hypothetical protein OHK0023_00510 [Anaerolineae bacterium]
MDYESALAAFYDILEEMKITHDCSKGQWFSLPAMKIGSRVYAGLWENADLIVKLNGTAHAEALALAGARLFQPMGDRSPMREWVQIPPMHRAQWREYCLAAYAYVVGLEAARRAKR